MRYLITFTCYGARLHGDDEGSVDPGHNQPGNRLLDAQPGRVAAETARMDQAPYFLDGECRRAVLEAIREVCLHRGWNLWAAHVRTNHVHVVVEGDTAPERIMNDFKAYASRRLNLSGLDAPGRRRWSRHGSTRWLAADESVQEAIRYVVYGQGEPMAVFLAELL